MSFRPGRTPAKAVPRKPNIAHVRSLLANRKELDKHAWYLRDRPRLERDRAIVAKLFPDWLWQFDHGNATVEGVLTILYPSGISKSVDVLIHFPVRYPEREPAVYDIKHLFKPLPGRDLLDRHLNEHGFCCLWLSALSGWNLASEDALLTFLAQVVIFFDRQFIYDITGKWPGPEWPHRNEAYALMVRERLGDELFSWFIGLVAGNKAPNRNAECVCGSQRAYKICHKPIAAELIRIVPQDALRELAGMAAVTSAV